MTDKLSIKIISILICGLIIFGICDLSNLNTYASGTFNLSSGYIEIEAEDITGFNTEYVQITNDENASGEKSLEFIRNSSSAEDKEHFGFTFATDVSEHLYMWIRVRTPNLSSDSMYYSFNSPSAVTSWLDGNIDGYYWKKHGFTQLTEGGSASVKFWARERGLLVDKIIITNNPAFVPLDKNDFSINDFSVDSAGNSIFNSPPITPPDSIHPRLLFKKEDIPVITEKLSDPEVKYTWDIMVNMANEDIDASLDTNKTNNYDNTLLNKITSRAFVYAMGHGNTEYAKSAIADIKDYLKTLRINDKTPDITRQVGSAMMTAAAVYDWCYDQLTNDDKDFFIRTVKSYALRKEVGYPPVKLNSLASHAGEGEVFGHLLSCGIAMWDEDKEIYNLAAGRIFDTMLDARKDWYKSGSHTAGNTYGATRLEWELVCNQLFIGMGIKDGILGNKTNIANTVKRYIYERLPMGKYMKWGDDWMWCGVSHTENSWWGYVRAVNYLAAYQTKDPYIKKAAYMDRHLMGDVHNQVLVANIIPIVLLLEPATDIKSFDELPLVNKTGYPMTSIQARTNWIMGTASNAAIAKLDASEKRFKNHDHANQGSFQLYYKGSLATEGGLYAHKDGDYGSSHYWNYYARTIASNCMTVYDPDEEFWASVNNKYTLLSNDGGQKLPELVKDYSDYNIKEPTATTEAYYIGPSENTPEFSFVKTNLTNTYGGHYEGEAFVNKVDNHTRSMVFMDLDNDEYPAALIVFDDIESSDASYKKTWNMNMVFEPEIDNVNKRFTVSRTDSGYNGKLVNSVLLPLDADITPVGGKGKESWVDGVNYPAKEHSEAVISEQGSWRCEISSLSDDKHEYFLNAMYVTDYDKSLPVMDTKIEETDKLYGVTMRDRSVYFPKSDVIDEPLSIELRDNGYESVKCLVTDLTPGLWKVVNNGDIKVYEVKANENSLYFMAKPGITDIIPVAEGIAGKIVYGDIIKSRNGEFLVWNSAKKDLVTLTSPTYIKSDAKMVPAGDIFKSLDAKVTENDKNISAAISGNIYTISPYYRHSLLNGKVNLVKVGAADKNGSIYVNSKDYFSGEYISSSKILKIHSADSSTRYIVSLKSGDTQVESAADISLDKPLTVSGKIYNSQNSDDDAAVYLAISNIDGLYSINSCKIDFYSTDIDSQFEVILDKLPEDIKNGKYNIDIYFWNNDISPYDGYKKINLLRGETE